MSIQWIFPIEKFQIENIFFESFACFFPIQHCYNLFYMHDEPVLPPLVFAITSSYDVQKSIMNALLPSMFFKESKCPLDWHRQKAQFENAVSLATTCKALYELYKPTLDKARAHLYRTQRQYELQTTALAATVYYNRWRQSRNIFKSGVRIGLEHHPDKFAILRLGPIHASNAIEAILFSSKSSLFSCRQIRYEFLGNLTEITQQVAMEWIRNSRAVLFVEPECQSYESWQEQTLADERFQHECSALEDLANCYDNKRAAYDDGEIKNCFLGNISTVVHSLERSGRMQIDEEEYYRKRKRQSVNCDLEDQDEDEERERKFSCDNTDNGDFLSID
jgi:hypothetical protein